MRTKSSHMMLQCGWWRHPLFGQPQTSIMCHSWRTHVGTFLSNTTNRLRSKFWLTEKSWGWLWAYTSSAVFLMWNVEWNCLISMLRKLVVLEILLNFMSWWNLRFRCEICVEILVWNLPARLKFGGRFYWKQGHFFAFEVRWAIAIERCPSVSR